MENGKGDIVSVKGMVFIAPVEGAIKESFYIHPLGVPDVSYIEEVVGDFILVNGTRPNVIELSPQRYARMCRFTKAEALGKFNGIPMVMVAKTGTKRGVKAARRKKEEA